MVCGGLCRFVVIRRSRLSVQKNWTPNEINYFNVTDQKNRF